MTGNPKHQYRSIFISDTHLGSRGCKSEFLLDFLEHHDCQQLYLVGDIFDGVVQFPAWLTKIGDWAYEHLLLLNRYYNKLRNSMGQPYWSLSRYIKEHAKSAVEYIDAYETALAREARHQGLDGVICGHIHHASIREIDGILYCNDGDWVESCTAMVEDWDGALHLVHWADSKAVMASEQESYVGQAVLPVTG